MSEIINLADCVDAFKESIGLSLNDFSTTAKEALEEVADSEVFLNLKDITDTLPFVEKGVFIYKCCKGISERHFANKIEVFINKFNEGLVSQEEIDHYKSRFSEDKKRAQQVEYLLIVLDRFIGYDKPRMLALLFKAFLDKRISWHEFSCYAEILDRLLPGDYEVLLHNQECKTSGFDTSASILRLIGLGLMMEAKQPSLFESNNSGGFRLTQKTINGFISDEYMYKRTEFGEKLVAIIKDDFAAK